MKSLSDLIGARRFPVMAAVLGGFVAWRLAVMLVPDVLGEGGRLLLVYGIGGALAALGMALHYRRSLAPVVGSSTAAAIAIVAGLLLLGAAVWASGWIFALTAGAQGVLAVLVVVTMVAAAATFVFVALSSLAVLLIALLRRRRGGAVESAQVRTLAVGAALSLMIIGSPLLVPDAGIGLYAYMVSGFPVHVPWYERDRALFSEVLEGTGCEVLVVPVEGKGPSLDRPGRDLITRFLAAEVSDQSGLCVADPELVWRALGRSRREFAGDDVQRLADRVGARWLVRGEAALAADRRSFRLQLSSFRRGARQGEEWQEQGKVRLDGVAFDDDNPPEQGVLRAVGSWPKQLGLPVAQNKAVPLPAPSPQRSLPSSPEGLTEDTGSPLDRAERLQLLASMLPPEHTETEALWARSLVALRGVPGSDAQAQVLGARANLHLNRRPYAERLLAEPKSSEAQHLHAIVRGDLKLAKETVDKVEAPVARLISQIEVERLRDDFGDTGSFRERRDELLAEHRAYASFLHKALSSDEWWFTELVMSLGSDLVARGVALEEPAGWIRLRSRAARILGRHWVPTDVAYLSGLIERSYAPHWRGKAGQWRRPLHDRLEERDLVEALFVLNRAAIDEELRVRTALQGLPERALREIGRVDPVLRSHPLIVTRSADTINYLRDPAPRMVKDILWQVTARLGTGVMQAESAENPTTERMAYILPWVREKPLVLDEPMRPWRAVPGDSPYRAATAPTGRGVRERAAAHNLRALGLTQSDFTYLEQAHDRLLKLGRTEDARRLLAENQDRFRGHMNRERFDVALAERSGDVKAQIALLRERIAREPGRWEDHYRLGRALLRERRPHDAEQALLSYPGFSDPGVNAVGSANNGRQGAWLLYWNGEPVLARALAETTMSFNTGAGSEMAAARYIALMRRDYREVLEWEEVRNQRYPSSAARANIAFFSFLLGDERRGWAALEEASELARDGDSLFAVHAGLRIGNADREQTLAYIDRWKLASRTRDFQAFTREMLVLVAFTLDRDPGEDDLKTLRRYGGHTADRSMQLFGEGYFAYRRGDYAVAVKSLSEVYAATLSLSMSGEKSQAYPLPYLAYALARSGRTDEAKRLLANFQQQAGSDNFFLIAHGMMEALEGRHERALEALWHAFVDPPSPGDFVIPPLFQLLEACEELYRATKDDRYRALLADIATRVRIAWPFSWAYAFEARYARNPEARRRAIAATVFLDPRSARLGSLPPNEIEEGRALLAKAHPFRRQ